MSSVNTWLDGQKEADFILQFESGRYNKQAFRLKRCWKEPTSGEDLEPLHSFHTG